MIRKCAATFNVRDAKISVEPLGATVAADEGSLPSPAEQAVSPAARTRAAAHSAAAAQ